ncbi:MAG: ATP-grasp domain-containing protein, partial [Desulfosarcinaceae bacterium]|nr:ATP-grasp domain-containing protein [Desulfosarcinaceae bacterium]
PQVYATLSQTSFDFLERSDLKGVASLTLAVDSATAQVVLTDLAVGNSRNIAFAAVSGGRPLFELATRLALGASLSEAYPEVAVSDDVVTVRLPIASGASRPDIRRSEGLNRLTQGDAMGIGPSFGDAFLRTLAATELPGEDVAPGSPMGSVRDGLHRYQEMRSTMQGDVSQSAESNAAAIAPWVMAALSEDAAQAPSPSGVGDPFVRLSASGPQTVPEYRWGRLSTTAKALGPKSKQRILVIAGRPNAIGQSREMDQAAAQSITALRDSGCEVMVLACDPLSAMLHAGGDTPICLGAATAATVLAIHQQWPLDGLMAHCAPGAFYGLASELATTGIAILGTSSRAIALLTSPMALHERLTKLGIPHPRCAMVSDVDAALEQADTIGYPLLIRPLTPSGGEPNLGGDSTSLIMNAEMLTATLQSKAFTDTSCLMEEFIEFAIEVTADALCDGNDTTMPQAVEHIELAGVHPGDSAWVIPPYSTPLRHVDTIAEYLHRIALEFDLKGFLSGRFALYNDTVYLLSADVAFSRTAAMVSDACAVPIFATATRLMLGESLSAKRLPVTRRGFYVREAVFPVSTDAKLASRLGPVMQSTGEVIGRADSFGLAYYNAQKAAGDRLPTEGCVLITVTDADKPSIIEPARLYREMGFRLLATRGTAGFLDSNGIATETVRKLGMGRPDLVDAIKTRQVDLIINTPSGHQGQMDDSYIRKAAIDYKIPYVSTPAGALAAAKGIAARRRQQERG